MAPKYKFTREEMIAAAVQVGREKGGGALSAKSLGMKLGISTQPVFTCFGSMDNVRSAVCSYAEELLSLYLDEGLRASEPFPGLCTEYIRFACNEPELYRLLFLQSSAADAPATITHARENVEAQMMKSYGMSPREADMYFSDVWLAVFGLAALIVTGKCPYTVDEVSAIFKRLCSGEFKLVKEAL